MFNHRGRGVRRVPGQMNRLEASYALLLKAEQQAGRVEWFAFDAIKLRLADKTFYTPDFLVMMADGVLEVREVKGFWEDDARVKIKIAAELFPLKFVAVSFNKARGWQYEEFGNVTA